MPNKDHRALDSNLPALSASRVPTRGSVHLPTDGGVLSRIRFKSGARFVRQHADYLDARTTQARSAQAYINACHELARSIARLDWLPEVLESDYLRGKRNRAHEIEMDRMAHATAEAHARAGLLEALQTAERFRPAPQSDTGAQVAPAALKGLTTAEVEMVAQRLPEMKRETIETLLMMLSGLLAEKNQ